MSHYLTPAEIQEALAEIATSRANLKMELRILDQKTEIVRLRCRHWNLSNRADYSGDRWRQCDDCGEINPRQVT